MIRSPKDGIDEMIERGKAIDRMLAGRPATDAQVEARESMAEVDAWLTRARNATARMDNGKIIAQ